MSTTGLAARIYREADAAIERLKAACAECREQEDLQTERALQAERECGNIRAATIEECKRTICDVFASTSPRDYMMNGSGGILKRMIDALHAIKEQQT